MRKLITAFLLAAVLYGCGSNIEQIYTSAEYLAMGHENMENKKYAKAAANFNKAGLYADTLEQSQEAMRYEADAYFLDKKYIDAIAAYELYYDFYNGAEDTPLVLYRLGISYAKLSHHPRADQTFTHSSVDNFELLKSLYPDKFVEYGAEPEYMRMRNKLAEHEYQVGRFYMRIKQPESALQRYLYLLRHYPDADRIEDTYVQLIEASMLIPDMHSVAVSYYEELEVLYPHNSSLKQLKKKLDE